MPVHTLPSRDFSRDVSNAKHLAGDGPVFITDRGKPAFALLKIEDYYRLSKAKPRSLLEVMDAIPGGDFESEVPRMDGDFEPVSFDWARCFSWTPMSCRSFGRASRRAMNMCSPGREGWAQPYESAHEGGR